MQAPRSITLLDYNTFLLNNKFIGMLADYKRKVYMVQYRTEVMEMLFCLLTIDVYTVHVREMNMMLYTVSVFNKFSKAVAGP